MKEKLPGNQNTNERVENKKLAIDILGPQDVELLKTIRTKTYADAPDVFGEEALSEIQGNDDAYWQEEAKAFASPGNFLVYAKIGEEPVGSVICFGRNDEEAGLGGVWIDSEQRGLGLATKLTDKAIEWAKMQGYTSITLWNIETNKGAEKLYLSRGFIFTDGRKEHPNMDKTTLLQMRLDLREQ